MNLEDKKINRFKFLKHLYDTVEGSESVMINMFELGAELGFDQEQTHNLVEYLKGEYLLEFKALGGQIVITHNGVLEIEESLSNPNNKTEHFPAFNVINIQSMNNSVIQQGTSNSRQNVTLGASDTEKIKFLIQEFLKIESQIPEGDLLVEFKSEITTLQAQADSPKPKSIIVKESLKSLRNIVEGVAVNLISPEGLAILSSLF